MNIFKQFLGIFEQNYKPETGEQIIKIFDNVWVNKGALAGDMKHTLVVTNKKLVISYNTLGGYPGFGFYFDPTTKVGGWWTSNNAVIEKISLEGDSVIINCKGGFKYIKITDKERASEIHSLLKEKLPA